MKLRVSKECIAEIATRVLVSNPKLAQLTTVERDELLADRADMLVEIETLTKIAARLEGENTDLIMRLYSQALRIGELEGNFKGGC